MPRARGRRIMRNAYVRTRQAVQSNHPVLKRVWRTRDAWLKKGQGLKGNLPPGALCQQKQGRTYPVWKVAPGPGGRRPTENKEFCSIYAVVHLENGKIYVGRTIKSPYERFQKHMSTKDTFSRAVQSTPNKFVVVLLEVTPRVLDGVPDEGTQIHWRKRENSWIHRLKAYTNGYNTRRELRRPSRPALPSHGFGVRRVTRSRQSTRIWKIGNNVWQGGRVFLSRDWRRRVDYFTGLINNRPYLVDAYMT